MLKFFDFICEEMTKPTLNKKLKIIGWQLKEIFSNKLIFEFPFEILTILNSTREILLEY